MAETTQIQKLRTILRTLVSLEDSYHLYRILNYNAFIHDAFNFQ